MTARRLAQHLLALALLAACAPRACARRFAVDDLRADFVLVAGRVSACPQRLSISAGSAARLPPSGMTVDGARCAGVGDTLLSPDDAVLRAGVPLPDLLKRPAARFIAGVDSAPRRCGRWTFNASAVTWFVANVGRSPLSDPATGATLSPRRAHVVLTALADACVLRSTERLASPVREGDRTPSATTEHSGTGVSNTDVAEHEAMAKPPAACFPGDATVRVPGGAAVRMRDLRVGDAVLARGGRYSRVFALSHAASTGLYTFVRLTTDGGRRVDVSEGHVMLARRGAVVAGELRVGDELAGAGVDEWLRVARVEHVVRRGLYNPHTVSGEIVVDGVLATTWTSAVPAVTATCALAPLRWWFRIAPRRVAAATGALLLPAIEAVQSVVAIR